MAKRKRGAQGGPAGQARDVPPLDNQAVNELVGLLDSGRFIEAILIMEELLQSYPREPILYKLLGMAYGEVGDLAGAAERWEEAQRLDPNDPSLWRLLAGVYQAQGRIANALRALRRYLSEDPDDEELAQVVEARDALEAALDELAQTHHVSKAEAERGGLLLERGLAAMGTEDYLGAARQFRDAARVIPGWTAPLNNLALCQFQLGNTDQALAGTEQVLSSAPDDVNALSALVRFLTILGRQAEAKAQADRLWALAQAAPTPAADDVAVPRFEFDRAANAFAFLAQDQRVIDMLERQPRDALSDSGLLYLGAALANVNRKPAALDVLKELEPHPVATQLAEAIRLNETPPGRRFPAISPGELLPGAIGERAAKEFTDIEAIADEQERRAAVAAFLGRMPTFLPAFVESLWIGDEVASANSVAILLQIGTPEAIEAVRTFAFGRLGPDDTRLHAALALRRAGHVEGNRPLLLWQDGRYQEMIPPRYEVSNGPEERDKPYPPAIARLMEKALERREREDIEGAQRFYRQVLAQDPTVVEAEQHLGLFALMEGDQAAAEQYFQHALALAPDFVLPRTALASLRIQQGKLDDARQLLIPLADRTNFRATEFGSYLFTTAELAAADNDPARARGQLRLLLGYLPGYTPARLRLRELERQEVERKQPQAQPQPGMSPLLQSPGGISLLGPR
ncbi:MAG: tetratricopeptide repeat protein [Thermomicrobiales bacterium]